MDFWIRKKVTLKEDWRSKWFLKNGSMFLEKLIGECNGISNPIRMFSSDQISKDMNHFDHSCYLYGEEFFNWYKGVNESRPYAVKKFEDPFFSEEDAGQIYNDIVISARISNHSGFLKLVGCCHEFCFSALVFENPENGVLNGRGGFGGEDGPLLPWNVRLKIAKEVVIAYLSSHNFP